MDNVKEMQLKSQEYVRRIRNIRQLKIAWTTNSLLTIPTELKENDTAWKKPLSYLPNPSARAGYDTRSIFKRSLTGLNSEFSFS